MAKEKEGVGKEYILGTARVRWRGTPAKVAPLTRVYCVDIVGVGEIAIAVCVATQ